MSERISHHAKECARRQIVYLEGGVRYDEHSDGMCRGADGKTRERRVAVECREPRTYMDAYKASTKQDRRQRQRRGASQVRECVCPPGGEPDARDPEHSAACEAHNQPASSSVESAAPKEIWREIVERVAQDAIGLAICRHDLQGDSDSDPINEAAIIRDVTDCLTGDDIGCGEESDADDPAICAGAFVRSKLAASSPVSKLVEALRGLAEETYFVPRPTFLPEELGRHGLTKPGVPMGHWSYRCELCAGIGEHKDTCVLYSHSLDGNAKGEV